jgi:hypothetical protein
MEHVRDGKPMILPNFANSITFLLTRIMGFPSLEHVNAEVLKRGAGFDIWYKLYADLY